MAAMAHLRAHRAHALALDHAARVAKVPVLVHVLLLAHRVRAQLAVLVRHELLARRAVATAAAALS